MTYDQEGKRSDCPLPRQQLNPRDRGGVERHEVRQLTGLWDCAVRWTHTISKLFNSTYGHDQKK